MYLHRLLKIAFWTFLLATCWFGLQQCDPSRLTHAFAVIDGGMRQTQKETETYNQNAFRDLTSYVGIYPQHQKNLALLQRLQETQRHYHLFLDSLRNQLFTATNLSAEQPLTVQPLTTMSTVGYNDMWLGFVFSIFFIVRAARFYTRNYW